MSDWTIGTVEKPGMGYLGTVNIDYKKDKDTDESHWEKIKIHGDNAEYLAEFICQKLNEELGSIPKFKVGDLVVNQSFVFPDNLVGKNSSGKAVVKKPIGLVSRVAGNRYYVKWGGMAKESGPLGEDILRKVISMKISED